MHSIIAHSACCHQIHSSVCVLQPRRRRVIPRPPVHTRTQRVVGNVWFVRHTPKYNYPPRPDLQWRPTTSYTCSPTAQTMPQRVHIHLVFNNYRHKNAMRKYVRSRSQTIWQILVVSAWAIQISKHLSAVEAWEHQLRARDCMLMMDTF